MENIQRMAAKRNRNKKLYAGRIIRIIQQTFAATGQVNFTSDPASPFPYRILPLKPLMERAAGGDPGS